MASERFLLLLPDAACALMCLCGAITDLRSMRIPNQLTYGGAVLGAALNFGVFWALRGFEEALTAGLLSSLAGCVLLFSIFAVLSAIGAMGMGDVKLMAAVGAFLRWPLCLYALAYALIAGGVISLGYAAARGQFRAVFYNIYTGAKSLLDGLGFNRSAGDGPRRDGAENRKPALQLHQIPYAAAILAGVAWAVLARYFSALRFP